MTSESNLERLISKILSQPVPYPSRPIIRYKLSTKDYQAILPPKSADIPSTGKSGKKYFVIIIRSPMFGVKDELGNTTIYLES